MTFLPAILAFVTAGLLLATAIPHSIRGERKPQKILFILSLAILTVSEVVLGFMLMTKSPGYALGLFHALLICSVLFPACAIPFFVVFGKRNDTDILKKHLPWFIALAILAIGASIALPADLFVTQIHFIEEGSFWGTIEAWDDENDDSRIFEVTGSLEPGEMDIVETQFGFHVIKVIDKKTAEDESISEVVITEEIEENRQKIREKKRKEKRIYKDLVGLNRDLDYTSKQLKYAKRELSLHL